jgi:hypothetical protein
MKLKLGLLLGEEMFSNSGNKLEAMSVEVPMAPCVHVISLGLFLVWHSHIFPHIISSKA